MTYPIAIALLLIAPLLVVATLRVTVEPERVKPEVLR